MKPISASVSSQPESTGRATRLKSASRAADSGRRECSICRLRLSVAGQTARWLASFVDLKGICEDHLASRHHLGVIALFKTHDPAQGDRIVAQPTLVRQLPPPIKRVRGDRANLGRALVGMDPKTLDGSNRPV